MSKVTEILKAKARKLTDDQVLEGIWLLNKPQAQMTVDENLVRAVLIDIYVERTSPEAGDTLMDELGL
jgi:hypothetical protein